MKLLTKRKLPISNLLLALLLVVGGALSPGLAGATTYTLTDGNSSATVDPSSQAGMYNWRVDGVNHLYQQWFWYRVGNTAEQSINTISSPVVSQLAPNQLGIVYTAAGLFNVTIQYTLFGGQPGSGQADIGESIRVNNLSCSKLDFHFFQYSDFDLMGIPGGDTAEHVNANMVRQSKGDLAISETTILPTPSRWEIDYFDNTLNRLNDGVATTLSNTASPLGPGDVTWAFEWDKNIPKGGSLLISKDKQLSAVPIPPGALLLGSGLLGLVGVRRKIKA